MVRPNELGFARKGALEKLAARNGGAKAWHITGRVVELDPDDSRRVIIDFDGARISVSSGPWKLVPGALALVAVDTAGRPVRVEGPLTDRPVELDPGLPGPAPIIPMEGLAPRELTAEEAASIQETVAGLEGAKAELDAAGETLGNLSTALEATKGQISAVDAKATGAASRADYTYSQLDAVRQETNSAVQGLSEGVQGSLAEVAGAITSIGAGNGPAGVAAALKDYLSVPLHALTVEDNRAPSGAVKAALYDVVVTEQLLATKGVITSQLLADGAVTARTLNVVPKEATGGVEILPEGIRVIPAGEDGAAISLRANEENWLYFVEDGAATFSVSPGGELVAQGVSANDSLTYRGVELADVINELPRGVIAASRLAESVTVGTSPARLLACTFQTPPDDRMIRIGVSVGLFQGAARTFYELRQSAGSTVTSTNARVAQYYWPKKVGDYHNSVKFEDVYSMSELGWPKDTTITLGCFMRSLDSGQSQEVAAGFGARLIIEDAGPAVEVEAQEAYVPTPAAPAPTPKPPAKQNYKKRFDAMWGRSYKGNNTVYIWAPNTNKYAFHGQYNAANGVLRSYVGFDRSAIMAFCSGAEVVSARVYVRNTHTYSSAGLTARIGAHGKTGPAGSWGGDVTIDSGAKFTKGQGRWISFNAVRNGLKSGAICGVSFFPGPDQTSRMRYGHFSIADCTLEITVRK